MEAYQDEVANGFFGAFSPAHAQGGDAIAQLLDDDVKLSLDTLRLQGKKAVGDQLTRQKGPFEVKEKSFVLVDQNHMVISGIALRSENRVYFSFGIELKGTEIMITNIILGRQNDNV